MNSYDVFVHSVSMASADSNEVLLLDELHDLTLHDDLVSHDSSVDEECCSATVMWTMFMF